MSDNSSTARLLNEVESKQLLESVGIATTSARLATSSKEAVAIAADLGYPVALKVVSDDVPHKSDAGGVHLDLQSPADVEAAYDSILGSVGARHPNANADGVSVQRMAPPGVEVVIGVSRDGQFGPVMMFGLGGVLVELLKDVAFRLVPLERADALEMIDEIKGSALLDGYRGTPVADRQGLVDLMLKVSAFVSSRPDIAQLDLNPVFAYPDGAIAVDARIVVSG